MATSGADRFYFATDTLPERERFPMFCEEVARCYTGLDLKTDDRSQFRATLELQRIGNIGVGRNATTAVRSARTADLIRDGDDSLLVTLLEFGRATQIQRDNNQILAPGDAVVGDCGYRGELNIEVDSRFWNLKIPRRYVAGLFPHIRQFAGARLDRNPAALRLLFGYLDAVGRVGLGRASIGNPIYEDHIVDLVALALGVDGDVCREAERRGARAIRSSAVLHEIERRSGDPELSAASVARALGVTPRYIHLLLEPTGKSFTHHVLDRRLKRAAALLRDPRRHNCKIADIAAEAGFTDLSYFNRAFRRHFSATPSDIRSASS